MIRFTNSLSIKISIKVMQCCLSFSLVNKGNFKIKIVWEAGSRVSSTPSVIEETMMFKYKF